MGDVNCTYAGRPSDECGCGVLVTVERVMQLRSACARQGPSGSNANASGFGNVGAVWPRYGSANFSRTPAESACGAHVPECEFEVFRQGSNSFWCTHVASESGKECVAVDAGEVKDMLSLVGFGSNI